MYRVLEGKERRDSDFPSSGDEEGEGREVGRGCGLRGESHYLRKKKDLQPLCAAGGRGGGERKAQKFLISSGALRRKVKKKKEKRVVDLCRQKITKKESKVRPAPAALRGKEGVAPIREKKVENYPHCNFLHIDRKKGRRRRAGFPFVGAERKKGTESWGDTFVYMLDQLWVKGGESLFTLVAHVLYAVGKKEEEEKKTSH